MKALVLVDLQNDFAPGGSLAVPHGDETVPVANRLMPHFPLVIATKDWHPADHGSFAASHPGRQPFELGELGGLPQVLWPVHCVANTQGADFIPGLHTDAIHHTVEKGTSAAIDSYSGFFDNGYRKATTLGTILTDADVQDLYVMGLATDYCVKATVVDGCKMGFRVHVITDGCRAVELNRGDAERAFREMEAAGAILVTSDEVIGGADHRHDHHGESHMDAQPEKADLLHEGRFLRFLRKGRWEYVERTNCDIAVVIIAMTDEGHVIFTEQYRVPMNARVIELPAGLAGDSAEFHGESLQIAAARELREETGYAAERFDILAEGPISPGLSTERIALVRATGLRKVGKGGGDETENIVVHEVLLGEVEEWLDQRRAEGILVDPKLFSGLYFLGRGMDA